MSCLFRRVLFGALALSLAGILSAPERCVAADDVLARVRERGVLHCAGIVRPGIAVPTLDGQHWYGIAADVCRAVAGAVLGDPSRMTFRPYFDGKTLTGGADTLDDVVFLSSTQLVGDAAPGAAPLVLGPVIAHDAIALLVPGAGAAHVAELARKTVCVEPGSRADRALTSYFAQRAWELREHPFQETDEMRQAYGDGNCAALAGPLTTLASVRADPQDGHRSDRLLPELLADDPIFATTAGDARWSRIIWWTFSALVDAESAGVGARAGDAGAAIPGVPPALAGDLGLDAHWTRDALAAGGNYAELFEHDLGSRSRFGLARGANALGRDGGQIFGLFEQ
jgi:general L-amino acid transport system substrate-binding protein